MDTLNMADDDFIASYRSSARALSVQFADSGRHPSFGYKKESKNIKLMNEILGHNNPASFAYNDTSVEYSDDEGGATTYKKQIHALK